MGLFDIFFGRKPKKNEPSRPNELFSLQVLFPDLPSLDTASLTAELRRFHPSLKSARFDIEPEAAAKGTPIGQAVWGKHTIDIVGFDVPMPAPSVEATVQPAHYGSDLKTRARAHRAHLILYHNGVETSPLERYVALAVIVGVLAKRGAIVVLNEAASTSFPAEALNGAEGGEDSLEILRTLPLLVLYCGFVKYDVAGTNGTWMRTFGCHLFKLPDFAYFATGHDQGEFIFGLFTSLHDYLRESGKQFLPGHTMQVGDDLFARVRKPVADEYFLESKGELLVIELISEAETNIHR